MGTRPIGVFDSGVGGLTVLSAVRELLPNEEFIYFGDSGNCPFGEKSDAELREIVTRATEFLLEFNAKAIIVACNTATTRMIPYLRETYPDIPFVGTEPAVKVACDMDARKIFILATEGTVHSKRLNELISENMREGQEILAVPLPELASAIEDNDEKAINDSLELNILKNFSEEDRSLADVVVLGCTHYPIVREKIQVLFPNAKLVDSGPGVARQTRRVLSELGLLSPATKEGSVRYFFSSAEDATPREVPAPFQIGGFKL